MRRRFALLVAVLALLGGGAAVALGAASGSSPTRAGSKHHKAHRRASIVSTAAAYLGVSPAQLQQQLHSGKTLAEIADATSGHSTSGLIAALVASNTAHLTQRFTALVNHSRDAKAAHRSSRLHSSPTAVLAYLGLSRDQLGKQIRAGRSLAEIADVIPGKSAAGLGEAIFTALQERLDTAVASGRLSKTKQAERETRLHERVTLLIQRKRTAAKTTH